MLFPFKPAPGPKACIPETGAGNTVYIAGV